MIGLRSYLKELRTGDVNDPVVALAWRLASAPEPLATTPAELTFGLWRSGASPSVLLTAHDVLTRYEAAYIASFAEPHPSDATASA